MTLITHSYPTPLGELSALVSPQGLCLLGFRSGTRYLAREWAQVERSRGGPAEPGSSAVTRQLGSELSAYFNGKLRVFEVPLDLVGTPFQLQVWQALLTLRYGQTSSYTAVARQLGRPTAVRAVGAAIGQNKVYLIVPCHRVLGADHSLTGYGGGMPRKRWLLALEQGGVPPAEAIG